MSPVQHAFRNLRTTINYVASRLTPEQRAELMAMFAEWVAKKQPENKAA
jgi:Spy/CpxP family protein refolding chaperone